LQAPLDAEGTQLAEFMVLIVHCGASINTADYYSNVMVDFYLFFFLIA